MADRIDCAALARGLDAWSWIEVLQRHGRTVRRGRIEVRVYPLRQVFADVERGYRGDERLRAGLVRLLADDAAREGRAGWPAPGVPAWVGVGPVLRGRYQGGDPVVERRWLAR